MQTKLRANGFAVVCLLSVFLFLPSASNGQIEHQKGEPERLVIEDEQGLYAHWYLANMNNDVVRGIGFAQKYVDRFPSGQMADFLKQYLDKHLPEHPDALTKFKAERMDTLVVKPPAVEEPKTEETNRAIVEIPQDAEIILRLLYEVINDGASVNARSRSGYTALMLAAMTNHSEVIKKMFERGADVNLKEPAQGFTALTYAIWTGNPEIVRLLLENGADRLLRDTEGRTALDHANLRGVAETIKLLEGNKK
ncbi:MAG: ankyrin repeat domain-containing protein [Acidobacteriota bacterium]